MRDRDCPSPAGRSPPGRCRPACTLVALSTPPGLVDPASIPATAWNAATVGAALAAGDVVQLTEPAWNGWRGGESAATVWRAGDRVRGVRATGSTRLIQIGAPLPTQSRDEVAAVVLTATVADAVVGRSAPAGRPP